MQLVVTGLHGYVRNPMYVGVLAMIFGQALFQGNRGTLIYGLCAALGFHLFVVLYEEPALRDRFGAEYQAYCRQVGPVDSARTLAPLRAHRECGAQIQQYPLHPSQRP